MPVDMKKYPPNWGKVRTAILTRAGGEEPDCRVGALCEWCGVRNYAAGYRAADGSFIPLRGNSHLDSFGYATSYRESRALADFENESEFANNHGERYIVIVLTIAHVHDPNPHNVDPSNLAALCQRCHIRWDARKRRDARRRKEGLPLELDEVQLRH